MQILSSLSAPSLRVIRVPESIAALNGSSRAVGSRYRTMMKSGYRFAHWGPSPATGTMDVYLSAAPDHMTPAEATRALRQKISPLIRVVSTTASPVLAAYNREQDIDPYKAGDLIVQQLDPGTAACSTGFTVFGTTGYTRAMTAAHCGDGTWTNGGYTINSDFDVVKDSDYTLTLGNTSNYKFSGKDDVQLLENPSDESAFFPYVWVGVGTAQPTEMAQGGPLTSYPAIGTQLTTDGAFSRTTRYVPVLEAGSNQCVTLSNYGNYEVCDQIQLAAKSATGATPTARQGDSGGPVFCYSCVSGAVTPAGDVEGIGSNGVFATFIGAELSQLGAKMDVP